MGLIDAIILGIIQGLTEFLPVSSSGHLELAKHILGNNKIPEESMLFTVVVHFATALSTIVIFRKDIMEILKGLFQFAWNDSFIFSLKIILSMIPAAVIGYCYEDVLASLFNANILLIGAMLLITALLLLLADRAKNTDKEVSYMHAILIGIAQAFAMLPGISRSGATIATAVLLGVDRSKSARFSFLMVIPLIFGKIAKDCIEGTLFTESNDMLVLSSGFIAAFIAGLLACTWMIALVKKSSLKHFAIYCTVVGIFAITYSIS